MSSGLIHGDLFVMGKKRELKPTLEAQYSISEGLPTSKNVQLLSLADKLVDLKIIKLES